MTTIAKHSKNRYGNLYGCHTPKETRKAVHALEDAGFKIEDMSWHNDGADRVQVLTFEQITVEVWMPNPEESEFLNHFRVEVNNNFQNQHPNAIELLEFDTIEKVIEFLKGDAFKLARTFADQLREDIGIRKLKKVIIINSVEVDSSVCHSHDFCDANMTMFEAFTKAFGREMRMGDDDVDGKDSELFDHAWNIAKALNFFVEL